MFAYLKPEYVTFNKKRHLSFQGQAYPSVTSILAATKPQKDRLALQQWRQKIGTKQAQQITVDASRRGISLHLAIKNYLQQQQITAEIENNLYWSSIKPVLDRVEQVYLVESAVYHSLYQYAGCFDCLGIWEKKLCVFDWKTSAKPKKSEWITDYFLQVTAYIKAINYLYHTNIDRGIIAIAIAEQPAQIFNLEANDLAYYWQQFLSRLRQWKFFQAE
jgi:ATP-dependent exoDNAse (exonuclease V) beta subunit